MPMLLALAITFYQTCNWTPEMYFLNATCSQECHCHCLLILLDFSSLQPVYNFPKDTSYQHLLQPVMLLAMNKGIPGFKGTYHYQVYIRLEYWTSLEPGLPFNSRKVTHSPDPSEESSAGDTEKTTTTLLELTIIVI
ncbi:hypothetical protein Peur_014577 [Populus x canadensis]